jgi:MFS family permease
MKLLGRVRTLFAEKDFRVLMGSQYLAQAADGFMQAALAVELILEPGGNTPQELLAVVVLTLLPYSLIAPFMGVFVDRWPRRSLLVWTNVARALILASLPFWWSPSGGDRPLYAAALLLLGLGRLFLVTKGATLPVVLHDHQLLKGNAISGGGGMISALGGGMVGVAASGALGIEPSLIIAAGFYGASALVARFLSDPMAHPHTRLERILDSLARLTRELLEGLGEVWRRPHARLPLIGIFIVRTAGMLSAFAAILIIKSTYPDAEDQLGRNGASALALGTAGVGAFVGAVFAPALGRRFDNPRLVLLGFGASGIGIVVLGGIESLAAVVVLTFIGGFGAFTAKVAVDAQVQEAMPDEFRGRAFALYDILYNLASVAAAGALVISEDVSLRILLVAAGALSLLLAGALAHAMRKTGVLVTAERT